MADVKQPPTPTWQPATPARRGPAEGVAYAGFWVRFIAWIVDGIAIGILAGAISPLLGLSPFVTVTDTTIAPDYGSGAVSGLVGLVYFVGLWSWKGQTIGMMPFGLSVAREEDGGSLDVVRAFLRYVGLIISFAVLLLGVIWVAFDANKQGWHDKIAKTVVVRR